MPLQQLFFDELPTLARQPPRPREASTSLAIAHTSGCTESSSPRTIVTSHLTIFASTSAITTIPLKVCRSCLPSQHKISADLPHQMYATVRTPTTSTWTAVDIISLPTFYSIPPPPCPNPHLQACTHQHCPDATNCTCNSAPATASTTGSVTIAPCAHHHCPDSDNCTCTTQTNCVDPSHHLFSLSEPHSMCGFAHCADPDVHIRDTTNSTTQAPCPDPSLHELNRIQPVSPRSIILSTWADQQMEPFSISSHSVSFTSSCAALINFAISHYPHTSEFPPLNLDAFHHQRPDHASPRGIVYVILQLHSESLVRDQSQHLGHTCPIVNCPLQILAELRNANSTSSGTSFNQLLRLTRDRMTLRLSQQ
jgi:hypothetical protein